VACYVQMWEKVKASNPSLGVCEISATIGRLWRELGPEDKQRHNDEYTLDKVPLLNLGIISWQKIHIDYG